jgi:ryanodine receptor 2
MAIAAKRTREFRCPPQEQMRALLSFRKEIMEMEEERLGIKLDCPCSEGLRHHLTNFHQELLDHCHHPPPEDEEADEKHMTEEKTVSWGERLLALVARVEDQLEQDNLDPTPGLCDYGKL